MKDLKKIKTLILVLFLSVLLDQIIKIIVSYKMDLNDSITIINNFFNITCAHNIGAAWSILSGGRIILILLGLIAIDVIYIFFVYNKNLDKRDQILYGLLMGGILGNLLDRLFYSSHFDKRFKVGAAFAVARRAGTTATFDELNKYFTINQMPVASGRYWNNGFGREQGQIEQDEEGLQNARVVARNMVFLMKAIRDAKEKYGLPEKEETKYTHFIK